MTLLSRCILFLTLTVMTLQLEAQLILIDKIVGVVGKNQILYSDVEDQYLQLKAQGTKPMPTKCDVFEELLSQKLLVNQADVDSILIEEAQVEMELLERVNYFVSQIGSEEKLIEYFGKSILEIKEDMRDAIRDQMLMQRMRGEITANMSVTPQEVRSYFNNMAKDSIPYIDAEVEINQIVIRPASNEQAVFEMREKLLRMRERIMNGDKFATLAVLYSEGPSASRGGDISWGSRAELDPAYSKAAFALKKGQVSKIVESAFGFHIIQLIEKSDERIHTRHILMRPKISFEDKQKAQKKLDSLVTIIRLDTLSFEHAAMRYSSDEDTRRNGGLMVNSYTGTTQFQLDQFETREHLIIRDLKVGEISEPYETKDEKGNVIYKIIRLKSKSEPHRANMKLDYELLRRMTTQMKQNEIVDEWVADKINSTYVKINEPYTDCTFRIKGWQR